MLTTQPQGRWPWGLPSPFPQPLPLARSSETQALQAPSAQGTLSGRSPFRPHAAGHAQQSLIRRQNGLVLSRPPDPRHQSAHQEAQTPTQGHSIAAPCGGGQGLASSLNLRKQTRCRREGARSALGGEEAEQQPHGVLGRETPRPPQALRPLSQCPGQKLCSATTSADPGLSGARPGPSLRSSAAPSHSVLSPPLSDPDSMAD